MKEKEKMHDWKLMKGSNLTYQCDKCGVLGHSVDRYNKCSTIAASKFAPYDGDCDLNLISSVIYS
jgi:hypothetical protein